MITLDKLVLPDELATWLQGRLSRTSHGTMTEAAVQAIAVAKSIDEAGTRERDRALALTADDLRKLADS